jgi:hypothetical protein
MNLGNYFKVVTDILSKIDNIEYRSKQELEDRKYENFVNYYYKSLVKSLSKPAKESSVA